MKKQQRAFANHVVGPCNAGTLTPNPWMTAFGFHSCLLAPQPGTKRVRRYWLKPRNQAKLHIIMPVGAGPKDVRLLLIVAKAQNEHSQQNKVCQKVTIELQLSSYVSTVHLMLAFPEPTSFCAEHIDAHACSFH